MKFKLAICLAALAAVCIAPFGITHAQKKNKNQPAQMSSNLQQQATTSTPPLQPGETYFYVTIRGVKQGIFKGQTTNAGHQGEIMGLQYLLQLTSPVNASTGQASGKRQYSPITFTKEWDASSPQIFEAASTNEVLALVEFDFVHADQTGKETVYQTIKLTNATISSVKDYMGFPDAGGKSDPRQLEDVSFTFQKIDISNNDGKTTAMDDWNAQL
jgi:type VI secretion system secreted protein Hcp